MIFTVASGTETPINSVIGFFGILKVNKEGTGSIMVWPKFFIQSNCDDFGKPPQAIQIKSA